MELHSNLPILFGMEAGNRKYDGCVKTPKGILGLPLAQIAINLFKIKPFPHK